MAYCFITQNKNDMVYFPHIAKTTSQPPFYFNKNTTIYKHIPKHSCFLNVKNKYNYYWLREDIYKIIKNMYKCNGLELGQLEKIYTRDIDEIDFTKFDPELDYKIKDLLQYNEVNFDNGQINIRIPNNIYKYTFKNEHVIGNVKYCNYIYINDIF
jgi:hypothetical protein